MSKLMIVKRCGLHTWLSNASAAKARKMLVQFSLYEDKGTYLLESKKGIYATNKFVIVASMNCFVWPPALWLLAGKAKQARREDQDHAKIHNNKLRPIKQYGSTTSRDQSP